MDMGLSRIISHLLDPAELQHLSFAPLWSRTIQFPIVPALPASCRSLNLTPLLSCIFPLLVARFWHCTQLYCTVVYTYPPCNH